MTKEEIIERVEELGVGIRGTDDEQIVPDMVKGLVALRDISYDQAIQEVLYGEGVA